MKDEKPLRILFAEDLPSDAELAQEEIRKGGIEFTSRRVETKEAFLKALREFHPDLIVSDYRMPTFDGMQALKLSLEYDSMIPVIILTGSMNEETAVECLRAGAVDYVIKEHITRLPFAIREAFEQKKMRSAKEKAEGALRESEERLRILFEYAPDAYYLSDLTGTFLDGNKAAEELTGYRKEELIGSNFLKLHLLRPNQLVKASSLLAQNFLGRPTGPDEFVLTRKGGPEATVEIRTFPVKVKDKTVVLGIARDITERKRAEEANTLLAQTLKAVQDCISVTDLDNRILFVNDAFLATYGYDAEDLIGKSIAIVRPTSVSPQEHGELLSSTVRGNWHGELVNRRKDGSEFPIELWTSVVHDGAGKPIASAGAARDITERKCADDNLKKSEEKFRELFENAPIGYHELDAMGTITNVNVTELRMLGYTAEEMVGRPVWEFVGGGDLSRKRVLAKLTGALSPTKNTERSYLRKDGTSIPVMVDESVLRNQRGEISGMRTVIQDITEKRRTEEVLLESNAFNAQLVRTLPLGMDIVDDQGEILFMSDAMRSLVGSDALGTRCWSTYKDDRQQCHDCPLHVGIDFEKPKMLESTGVLGGKTFQISHIGMMYQGKKAMLEVFEDVSERKKSERALRQSEEKYRSLFEESKDIVYISTPDGKLLDINPAGVEVLGYKTKEEMLQLETVHASFADPRRREEMRKLMEDQGFVRNFEEVLRGKDGRKIIVLDTATAVRNAEGQTILFRGILRDVTKEKQLEEELTQMQKLESIGTLASGIAHDFNNILGIILGYSTLLERLREDPEKHSESVVAITKATQRGASLVKQLLIFARKSDALLESVRINDIIAEITKLLKDTFPKTITISTSLQQDLPSVVADASQIHQVLLNLCVNARDAMPKSGTLSISTRTVKGEALSSRFEKATGYPMARQYVEIEVADTGIGMDERTRRRIFEPFFTTKPPGKGTGLGLAVVYGIVEHHTGFIDVRSAPGEGTSFIVHFPIPEHALEDVQVARKSQEEIPGGTETILIIEDEEMLRELLKASLVSKGYTVLTAEDGMQGVEMYQNNQKEIAVVLSDMGLPLLSGQDVFRKIREINLGAKVIFASGFIEPEAKSQMYRAGIKNFIQKPYLHDEVLQKIRTAIDTNG